MSTYMCNCRLLFFFFFNDTATTEIYTLSLHDALPIYERAAGRARDALRLRRPAGAGHGVVVLGVLGAAHPRAGRVGHRARSEEHKSEPPVTPISRMPASA